MDYYSYLTGKCHYTIDTAKRRVSSINKMRDIGISEEELLTSNVDDLVDMYSESVKRYPTRAIRAIYRNAVRSYREYKAYVC